MRQLQDKDDGTVLILHCTWHVTSDTWHLTSDIWHLTSDIWHLTLDIWHLMHDTWTDTPCDIGYDMCVRECLFITILDQKSGFFKKFIPKKKEEGESIQISKSLTTLPGKPYIHHTSTRHSTCIYLYIYIQLLLLLLRLLKLVSLPMYNTKDILDLIKQ